MRIDNGDVAYPLNFSVFSQNMQCYQKQRDARESTPLFAEDDSNPPRSTRVQLFRLQTPKYSQLTKRNDHEYNFT